MILVTIPRAAELYSVSASQMRRIITDWGIPVVKIGRSGVRVRMDDLTAYAEDHASEGRGNDLLAGRSQAVDRPVRFSGPVEYYQIRGAEDPTRVGGSSGHWEKLDPTRGLPPRMAG